MLRGMVTCGAPRAVTRCAILGAPLAAPALAQAGPVRLVADDRGGADDAPGAEAVARARPDGRALLHASNTAPASNPAQPRRPPDDPAAMFTHLAGIEPE